jgi:hypothetical protein
MFFVKVPVQFTLLLISLCRVENSRNVKGIQPHFFETQKLHFHFYLFIFFLNCHSRFLPYGFYGTFRSAVFPIHFPCSFAYR